jgi:tRNA dimethylallyltransferase
MADNKKLFVIMGPTASSKSDLAIKFAQAINGEIITADSMQLYKGMNIGTAKPTEKELSLVPHHLIDIFDITERVDVFTYVDLAKQKISEIRSRGKQPILAGGTGMYIRALLYGLDPMPSDRELRNKLDEKYDNEKGFEELKAVMQELDPVDYDKWHMHRRKLIRALEVFTITGHSITELQKVWDFELQFPAVVWNLVWDRAELRNRIFQRTELMLQSGWIDEAKELIRRKVFDTPTAHQVLGYKYIRMYLDGEINYDEMKNTIATKTWQLARKQITWFKTKHPEAEKIAMPCDFSQLLTQYQSTS